MSSLILANQFRVQYSTVHMFSVKFIFIFHKIHQQSSSLKRMFNQKNFPLIKYYSCGLKCIGVTPQFHDFRWITEGLVILLSLISCILFHIWKFSLSVMVSWYPVNHTSHMFVLYSQFLITHAYINLWA